MERKKESKKIRKKVERIRKKKASKKVERKKKD